MKKLLVIFLLLFFISLAEAQEDPYQQVISISFDDVSLKDAILEVQKMTKLGFAYNGDMPELQQRVSLNFEKQELRSVLDELFKESNIKHKFTAGQIILYKEKKRGSAKITGSVIDGKSMEPLPFVNIVLEGTSIGTVTDESGRFAFENLDAGRYILLVSFLGYKQSDVEAVQISDGETIRMDGIPLAASGITLKSVTITPGSFSVMGSLPPSYQTIEKKDIKNMSFAEDITRAVSRLPGVSSNDYSSKFTVRGGEADEVLITLDGMELYEPFHQRDFAGGLFSIVDIETIEGVDLLTGGFSAEYGNRQSGVFNMTTNGVRQNERHTAVGLSVMNASIYTDGRFSNNKGSYLASARRGMLDQTFKLIDEKENIPKFYDAMGKVDYQLGKKHILSFHLLYAADETAVRDISPEAHDIHDTEYSNFYSWITLKSFLNSRVSAKTIMFGGNINHKRNGDAEKYEYSDKLNFKLSDKRAYLFFGVKQDWSFDVSDKLNVKSGFEVKQLNADYDYSYQIVDWRINAADSLVYYRDSAGIITKPDGQQLGVYVSSRLQVLPKLYLESGLRYDHTTYTNDNLVSPRISLAYAFSDKTIARAAWGYYYQSQFINNLDVNHKASGFDEAELSKHYVVGIEHTFGKGISARLEGYYKDISNLSPAFQNLRDPWEVFPESRNDIAKLHYDGAFSRGIELFLKYDMNKKISWWFSYSLAEAKENIVAIEFNGLLMEQTGELPRINNQRHTIYCDLNYRMNVKWHFNLSWQYYAGWPLTIYDYDFAALPNGDLHFYQRHGKFRGSEYPDYHRMDLRINRSFFFEKSKLSAYLHIINIYNRENLRKFDLDNTDESGNLIPDGSGGYLYPHDDKNWFGITPVIGMSIQF